MPGDRSDAGCGRCYKCRQGTGCLHALGFANRSDRRGPKVTADVHDAHVVRVTEHRDERVDVCVSMGEKPCLTSA